MHYSLKIAFVGIMFLGMQSVGYAYSHRMRVQDNSNWMPEEWSEGATLGWQELPPEPVRRNFRQRQQMRPQQQMQMRQMPQMQVLAKNISAKGRVFVFNPNRLQWTAYAEGRPVASGRASGGQHYCRDIHRGCKTPIGHFHVTSKGSASCISTKFPIGRGGAPMPYCMFFHGGYAVHGSYDVPNYNASHGCIRVPPGDAQWLSHNFMQTGTAVVVLPY